MVGAGIARQARYPGRAFVGHRVDERGETHRVERRSDVAGAAAGTERLNQEVGHTLQRRGRVLSGLRLHYLVVERSHRGPGSLAGTLVGLAVQRLKEV